MVQLKYLSNFWRNFKMPLIYCEINLFLTWSTNCFINSGTIDGSEPTFLITDTKLYIPIVTLSSDNTKLLQQLRRGFRRTIKWNKNQSKVATQTRNQSLDYFIDTNFQR